MNKIKRGHKLTMFFHGFGAVSEEECIIMDFDEKTITIDDIEDGRVFSRRTGKCLNDNTDFGCKRTIKPV